MVFRDEPGQAALHEGKGDERRHEREQAVPDHQLEAFLVRSVEAQPDIAVGGVVGVERQRADHEPGRGDGEREPQDEVVERGEMAHGVVDAEQREGDQPPLEDRDGVGEILEAFAVDAGMAVEIAALADLGPRRVDPEGDDAEREVDDPDPEILAGGGGELDRVAHLDRVGTHSGIGYDRRLVGAHEAAIDWRQRHISPFLPSYGHSRTIARRAGPTAERRGPP